MNFAISFAYLLSDSSDLSSLKILEIERDEQE